MATEGIRESLRSSWVWEFLCFTTEAFYQIFLELVQDPSYSYFQMGHHHGRKRIRRAGSVSSTLEARPENSSPLAKHVCTSEDLSYSPFLEDDKRNSIENEDKDTSTDSSDTRHENVTEERCHETVAKVITRLVRFLKGMLTRDECTHEQDPLLAAVDTPASEDAVAGASAVVEEDERTPNSSSPLLSLSAQIRSKKPAGYQLMQAQIRAREGSSRRKAEKKRTAEEMESGNEKRLKRKQAEMERKERKSNAIKEWQRRHEERARPHKELRTLGKRRRSTGDVEEAIKRSRT